MEKVSDLQILLEVETVDNGYTILIGETASYFAIYKPGLKIAPYQRSYSMSGHVNYIGIVVDDLDEIERCVKLVGFGPHIHADYEPGCRFYFYDDTGLEIEVVSYNS